MTEQNITSAPATDGDITPDGTIAPAEIAAPVSTFVPERAFYRADYIRFGQFLQRARHIKGNYSTPKSVKAQETIDALVEAMSTIFAADSAAHGSDGYAAFDAEVFAAGTLPPAPVAFDSADGEESDGE